MINCSSVDLVEVTIRDEEKFGKVGDCWQVETWLAMWWFPHWCSLDAKMNPSRCHYVILVEMSQGLAVVEIHLLLKNCANYRYKTDNAYIFEDNECSAGLSSSVV